MNLLTPKALVRFSRTVAGALLVVLAALPLTARADTVASLLGNFTINQYCGLTLAHESLELRYVVVFGQLPALRELHVADVNGDGVTSQAERDDYVRRLAPEFARQLRVTVDGLSVPLRLVHWTSSLPTEQGGFSLRLDADFAGTLPPGSARGIHRLELANGNYAGRIGWHEIAVLPGGGFRIFATNAYANSLTGGLTEALQALPASGPLDETSIHLSFTGGLLPANARPIEPRPGTRMSAGAPAAQESSAAEAAWLQAQTRRLVALISAPTVAPHVAILALLIALVLGAFHALSPGHGKTIVGAYLIGSRGTPRHAAFLGLTVTITHTLGVFALGFATLFASRYVVPEKLFPILSLVSGLLVLGMGMVLLAQRWRGARAALGRRRYVEIQQPHALRPPNAHAAAHQHPHHPLPAHDHGHDHAQGGAGMHSHGGSMHSHLPVGANGAPVTWRSLLALGISGGLIPCPSAMVLLLAAVALNKTAYGLLLVVAFSVGLAITLTAIGLAFLYARNHLRIGSAGAPWRHALPVLSAALITVVGAVLCFNALQSAQL
jgi:ABC-type nickel/cobalt efflux system permease component RcnA